MHQSLCKPQFPSPGIGTTGHTARPTYGKRDKDAAGPQLLIKTKETDMNWDRIEGNWKQAKGKVKEQWGRLTDDHLDIIDGRRERLLGQIQESYGIAMDEAESQVQAWEKRNARAFNEAARRVTR